MVNTRIPTLKPVCELQGVNFTTGVCSHGYVVRRPLGCGQIERCQPCYNAYIGKIRRRITDGIEHGQGSSYKFFTFTLCRHTRTTETHCQQCYQPLANCKLPTVSAILDAWRNLRRLYWRTPLRFFRILEPHKDGTVHLHGIVEGSPFPDVSKARHRESLAAYVARQSEPAHAFIMRLRRCGFGTIAHVEPAYSNGHGAAKYLTSYLTDGDGSKDVRDTIRTLRHPSGRRPRLYDASDSWHRNPAAPEFKYSMEYGHSDARPPDNVELLCDVCEQESTAANDNQRLAARRQRVDRWLLPVAASWSGMVLAWRRATAAYNRNMARRTANLRAIDLWLSAFLEPTIPKPRVIPYDTRQRERLLANFRAIGYTGPVGLLDYAIRSI